MNQALAEIAAELSTRDARLEFSIASVTRESPDEIRFRLDPGPAFERTGRILRDPSGEVILRLFQRYRPDGEMVLAAGAPLTGSLTSGLRSVIRQVNWPERRPCWRDAYRIQEPRWVRVKTVTSSGIIPEAFRAVTGAAREKNIAHYLWRAGAAKIAYGNNPSHAGVVFSVNPFGQWALHAGPETRPLETPPDLTALAEEPYTAARLAAEDLGAGAVATTRSDNQVDVIADRLASARPARRR